MKHLPAPEQLHLPLPKVVPLGTVRMGGIAGVLSMDERARLMLQFKIAFEAMLASKRGQQ